MSGVIQTCISEYLAKRDDFRTHGGEEFFQERNQLRIDYCRSSIDPERLTQWVHDIFDDSSREEFGRIFYDWEVKIAKGIFKKIEPSELTHDEFILKVNTFSKKYFDLLNSEIFQSFMKVANNLQNAATPELKKLGTEGFIKKYSITDEELIEVIKFEYKFLKA